MPKGPQGQKRPADVIGNQKRSLGEQLVEHLKARGGDIQLTTGEIMA